MCVREFDDGILCESTVRLARFITLGTGVRAGLPVEAKRLAAARDPAPVTDGVYDDFGFGVLLTSAETNRDLRVAMEPGVLVIVVLQVEKETSDIGGEGGSLSSEIVSAVDCDLVSGGVVIRGELAVELGECANPGDSSIDMSVEIVDKCRESCFLSLSCKISASIFRSDSSSRRRWASTRRRSRSCSPILISSSSMTALSMATLYLDSRSSSEELVFLAWRSKSSLATSMSRSFN